MAKVLHNQVDWLKVILDIRKTGLTIKQIGNKLDASATTVFNWGKGTEPRYSDGVALIDFWHKITGLDNPPVVKTNSNHFNRKRYTKH